MIMQNLKPSAHFCNFGRLLKIKIAYFGHCHSLGINLNFFFQIFKRKLRAFYQCLICQIWSSKLALVNLQSLEWHINFPIFS